MAYNFGFSRSPVRTMLGSYYSAVLFPRIFFCLKEGRSNTRIQKQKPWYKLNILAISGHNKLSKSNIVTFYSGLKSVKKMQFWEAELLLFALKDKNQRILKFFSNEAARCEEFKKNPLIF